MIKNLLRHRIRHAIHSFEIHQVRPHDSLSRAKMRQQRFFAFGTDAINII